MIYLIPLYQSGFIDSALKEKQFFTTGFYSFVILLAIYYGTEFISTAIDAVFTKKVKFQFEFLILRKFLNVKYEKNENYGKVTDILKKDLFFTEEYIYHKAFLGFFMVIIQFILIFSKFLQWDLKIFFIGLFFVSINVFLSLFDNKISKRLTEETRSNESDFFDETLPNIQNVKSYIFFNTWSHIKKQLISKINTISNLHRKNDVYSGLFSSLIEISKICSFVIIFVIALNNVVQNKLTYGELTAIIAYSVMIFKPVDSLMNGYKMLTQWEINFDRVNNLTNFYTQNEEKKICNDIVIKSIDTVEVNNLILPYKNEEKKKISFDINQNERLGVIGLSGEGKSTIIKILTKLKHCNDEVVKINSKYSLNNIGNANYYSKTNILLQDNYIFNDNLESNLTLNKSTLFSSDYKELAAYLGIDKLEGRKFGENGNLISGGETQRISLARFLLRKNYDFFIMDEPLLNLDSINLNNSLNLLKKHLKSKTGIIISHDLKIIENLCTRIIVIDNSEIIENDTFENLSKNDKLFSKLYKEHTNDK